MPFLSIKDNSPTPKEGFNSISGLIEKIADKTLAQLAKEGVFVFPELKDADDLTKEQMILRSVNNDYWSGNVMGFLGFEKDNIKQRLEIRSRFSTPNGDNAEKQGESESYDYFLLYMLQRVLDIPNIVDLKTNANREDRLFNWLMFLFPFYLKNAVRKGVYKTYIRRQYNDANVKGAIDVARHVKKNIPFLGKIAYNQREHSSDNYLMKLIRLTIDYIRSKPFGNNLLSKCRDEIQLITGATPGYAYKDKRKIIDENKKHTVRHAFYHEYRSLQQLCLWILQDEKNLIGHGSQQIFGILFDGAWLWEEYVNSLINQWFYHPMNKSGKGAQYLFNGSIGLIYPDFIGKDVGKMIIADAKYKRVGNIYGHDYQQILAYMLRFDAKLGLFIYPYKPDEHSSDNDNDHIAPQDKWFVKRELHVNKGSSYTKTENRDNNDWRVIKYGLLIPDKADSYEAFETQMKEVESEFCEQVNLLINPSSAQS